MRLLYQLKALHHKRAAGGGAGWQDPQVRGPDSQAGRAGGQRAREGGRLSLVRVVLARQVLPSLLDALWRLHRCDMERTVKEACKRVLRDPSQTVATLEARAHALVSLGRIFTAAARLPPPPPDHGAY